MNGPLRPGFTLAETLVVVAILSAVGIALMGIIASFYRSNAYILEQTTAVDNANRGLDISFSSLREATYGEDGSYPLQTAATSSLVFYSDIDTDNSVERVRVYLLKGSLYRVVTNAGGNPPTYSGQASATTTIATSVANAGASPLFRYYDANGAELPAPVNLSLVRSVRLTLLVDLNPTRAPEIVTLTSSATLRNLRSE
ncbi:MAG TPA: hypothetical protein VHO23_01870 [Candidatus Paceibacterota bacterium]|nr:hypothetical protein [Candidatus Paceibacterota bacterium]